LKGELWRKGMGVEKIAGAAREGGEAAKKLRLHTFPDQGARPLPIGAVRRIPAVTARTPEQVDAAYKKALRAGHEGAMVSHADGRVEKKKPRQDSEFTVESWGKGKRKVLHVSGADGTRFRVQSRAALAAKPGDRVTVSYSGTTRRGIPKAAVAERVRNEKDFSMKTADLKAEDRRQEARDQVKKDRRALLRGAVLAAGGIAGLAVLAKKSKGNAVGVPPWVPKTPVKAKKPLKQRAQAMQNAVDKHGADKANDRLMQAAKLRRNRAWSAIPTAEKPWGKGMSRQPVTIIDQAQKLAAAGAKGGPVVIPKNLPKGQMTEREAKGGVAGIGRMQHQRARQELLRLREARKFDTAGKEMKECQVSSGQFQAKNRQRDGWDKGRDVAVAGGALAGGGAAVYSASQVGKTNRVVQDTVKEVGRKLDPKEVLRTGVQEVKRGAKSKLREYFPTFSKWARQLKRPVKFSTPAMRVIEFAGAQQMKDPDTRAYADPLRVAAGMQRGYWETGKDGVPLVKDVPMMHSQVIRSAMNKGKKVQRVAKRSGSLAKDVADTLRGKERERDASGRVKKKEWEKQWFKNKVGQVATGGALLAGGAYLRGNPAARATVAKGEDWLIQKARKLNPDMFPSGKVFEREFSTPAQGLFGRIERKVRGTAAGKLLGPSAALRSTVKSRQALVTKLTAASKKGNERTGDLIGRAKRHAAMKQAKLKNTERRQKDAVAGVKRGASLVGTGALAGGAAMKLHADQPEDRKVHQGARFRNALIGAAAGSMLGGGLGAGKSGFRGARVGAAMGGLIGAISNPKRKQVIEELPVASFSTPASRLLNFDWAADEAGWDLRDPRGRSARVFAPGSRQRNRREKFWHERADNERKLWKGAVIAAGVTGLTGGTVLGKKLGKKAKVAPTASPPRATTPPAVVPSRVTRKPRAETRWNG
jgi:hypothetical protein